MEELYIKQKKSSAFPSKNGLYPDEILALSRAPRIKVDGNDSMMNSLLSKGFISLGGVKQTMENATAKELKDILSRLGLEVTGTKKELIDRLLANASEQYLHSVFPDKYYALTPLGTKELADNEYISLVTKNNDLRIDIWVANQLMHNERRAFYDVYLDDIQARLDAAVSAEEYYRCPYLLSEKIAVDIAKEEYYQAIESIALYVYYQISVERKINTYSSDSEDWRWKRFFPYSTSVRKIPYNVTNWFGLCTQRIKKLSDNELECLLKTYLANVRVSKSFIEVFSKADCAHIAVLELHSNGTELKQYYEKVAERILGKGAEGSSRK